jgi:hypothetical protein
MGGNGAALLALINPCCRPVTLGYCRTNLDRHGFPRGSYTRTKVVRSVRPATWCGLRHRRESTPAFTSVASLSVPPGPFSGVKHLDA